jgi:hypothetical protein
MILNVDTASEFLHSLDLIFSATSNMDIAREYLRRSSKKFVLTF